MTRLLTIGALLAALVAAALLTAGASATTAAAPSNTTAPEITGTPKVGQTLTVSNGTWTGSPTSFAYHWQRCTGSTCANIAGATSKTYTAVGADAGHTLRAVVAATNADGTSTANSAQTTVVAANGAPTSNLKPVVLGDAAVGQTLTATNGTWTGSPTSFTYQWLRCDDTGAACVQIIGATGKTYGVRVLDVGSRLRVAVTAKNAEGSTTARSDATDVVTAVPGTTTTVQGNKAPTLIFRSLRRVGARVYARFTVCDDRVGRVSVIERDAKAKTLAYTRRFSVTPNKCVTATRSWIPAARFRTKGRYVVTLRAVDKSGASSGFRSRSLLNR